MSDSQGSKSDSFEQFGSLPAEIRHQVWRSAAQGLPATEELSVCIYEPGSISPTREDVHVPQFVRQSNLVLRSTTKESRDIVKVQREFRPAEDVLYIRNQNCDGFVHRFRPPPPWAAELQHLAVPLSGNSGYTLPYALRHLPNLKTVYVVFPNATGEDINTNAKVNLSKAQEAHPSIRRLTQEEAKKLILKADFQRQMDLHGNLERVQYTTNAKDHTLGLFYDLQRNIRSSGDKDRQPVYWDSETNTLQLEHVAACFIER